MRAHRALAAATVAAGAVLGFASLAYGCASVTSPYVTAEPNRGQAATVTTVSGGNWAASAALTLHWATVDGPVLANVNTAADGGFAARVTVPADAAASVYYIVAVQDATPTDTVRRAPFEVIALGTVTDPGDNSSAPAGTTSAATSGGNATTGGSSGGASSATGSNASPTNSGGLPTNDSAPPANGSTVSSDQTQGPTPTRAASGNTNPPPPPAGATAAATERQQTRGVAVAAPAPAAVAADEDIAVPAASATGDVWGGFAEGPSRLAPSLVDLPASGGSTSPAVVGAVMGVLALVGLAGGFATAELRRRRVTVSEGSGR